MEEAGLLAHRALGGTTLQTDMALQIAEDRYQAVASSEKLLHRKFIDLSDIEREKVLKRRVEEWGKSTYGGDVRPFNDLYKEKRRTIDIDLRE